MGKVLYVHAHGAFKLVEHVAISDKGEVKKSDVISAINRLFEKYDKKIRNSQKAIDARDKVIRFVNQAKRVDGKALGQNVYTSGSFDNDDMKNYHIDLEFDMQVLFT